jgi:hypothetical protein
MEVVFTRIARSDGQIKLQELNEIVASHPALLQIPDRQMVNPFSQQPLVASGTGKAYYVENREPIGNLSLEGGELITTGIPRAVCEELASLLGACVFDADFS